jgi:hypothetical protein
MRHLWAIAASALAVACGSSANPIPLGRIYSPHLTAPEEGRALLVVTRDTGWKSKPCVARLYVDGLLIADLRSSEQIRLYVEEGPHLVGVSGERCLGGASQVSVDVSRAKPVLLRISAGSGADMKIEPSAF